LRERDIFFVLCRHIPRRDWFIEEIDNHIDLAVKVGVAVDRWESGDEGGVEKKGGGS